MFPCQRPFSPAPAHYHVRPDLRVVSQVCGIGAQLMEVLVVLVRWRRRFLSLQREAKHPTPG